MFSYGLLPMDTPVLDDQHRLTTVMWDTGCSLKDLPRVIDNRDKWRERKSENSVSLAWLYDEELLFSIRLEYFYHHVEMISKESISIMLEKKKTKKDVAF